MRHNLGSPIQFLKSMQSGPIEAIGVAEVEAEVVVVVAVKLALSLTLQHLHRPAPPDIVELDILIYLQVNGRGARCTSSTGNKLSSVQNLRLVHGRTSSPNAQANEI